MVSVSIVIPFFGKVQDLVPLIKSLNKLNTKNIKVQTIIIDDNSKEKFNIIKKLSKFKIKLLFNKKNYGPAYSRNLGVKNSKSDFIWFLDHDVTLTNINFLQIGIKLIGINKYDAISGAKEMINNYPTTLLPRIFPNFLSLYNKRRVGGEIFQLDNLKYFSIKYYEALQNINNCITGKNGPGTNFVYSRFIGNGIHMFESVLRENGYIDYYNIDQH